MRNYYKKKLACLAALFGAVLSTQVTFAGMPHRWICRNCCLNQFIAVVLESRLPLCGSPFSPATATRGHISSHRYNGANDNVNMDTTNNDTNDHSRRRGKSQQRFSNNVDNRNRRFRWYSVSLSVCPNRQQQCRQRKFNKLARVQEKLRQKYILPLTGEYPRDPMRSTENARHRHRNSDAAYEQQRKCDVTIIRETTQPTTKTTKTW